MDSPIWLLLLFFGFVLGAVLLAGYVLLGRTASHASAEASLAPGEGALSHPSGSMLGETLRSLGESVAHPGIVNAEVRKLLSRAGYRGPGALVAYQGALWTSAVVFALSMGGWGLVVRQSLFTAFVAGICGVGVGIMMPKRVLSALAKTRAKRLNRGLPNALDLLLLNIEAGRGMEQSIAETGRGIRLGFPELFDELNQVGLELKAGRGRSEVLWDLAERAGDLEIRKLVTLLVDTDRFGTSLGPALRAHARYLRTRRRQKAQETARKLSVKLVFPVFFLIFPSILLVTLGPAVIAIFTQLMPMLLGSK